MPNINLKRKIPIHFKNNDILDNHNDVHREIKDIVLNCIVEVKNLYDDKTKTIINNIAKNIQYKINNSSLNEHDIHNFIVELHKADVAKRHCEQLMHGIVILSKHKLSFFGRNFNWFWQSNTTKSIGLFLEDYIQKPTNDLIRTTNIIEKTLKGFINIDIGIVYSDMDLVEEGISNLNVAKLLINWKDKKLETYYDKLINSAKLVLTNMKQEYAPVINFTNYLYSLLEQIPK